MKTNHPIHPRLLLCKRGLGLLATGLILAGRALAADATATDTSKPGEAKKETSASGSGGGKPAILAGRTPATDSTAVDTSNPGEGKKGTGVSVSIGDKPSMDTILGGANVTDAAPSTEIGPGLVARVGGTDIKIEQLRAMVAGLDTREKEAMAANPALLKRIVFSMLVQEMVLKEVTSEKWDQKPEVQAHLEKVKETTLTDMFLKSVAQPPQDYPSPAELQAAYETHKESLVVPRQFQISQIFIALPQGNDKALIEKTKEKIDAVLKSLREPKADFAVVARAMSDDAKGAKAGGDMGWCGEKNLPPRILAQARTLPPNVPSEPIRLDDGWHIIKVLDTKDPAPLPLDEVKEKLAQQLRMERTQANMQAYVDKLLKQSPVAIDDKILPQVIAQPSK